MFFKNLILVRGRAVIFRVKFLVGQLQNEWHIETFLRRLSCFISCPNTIIRILWASRLSMNCIILIRKVWQKFPLTELYSAITNNNINHYTHAVTRCQMSVNSSTCPCGAQICQYLQRNVCQGGNALFSIIIQRYLFMNIVIMFVLAHG